MKEKLAQLFYNCIIKELLWNQLAYYLILNYKALSVAILDKYAHEIKDKNVVCILSGGTVDLSRFDEFKEHSQLYEGLKYFFLIEMPFKIGILKNFVSL